MSVCMGIAEIKFKRLKDPLNKVWRPVKCLYLVWGCMAPGCVGANRKELGYPAITQQRLEPGHVGCMALTKAEMSHKAPTIRSIEMLAKPGEKDMSVARKACSLRCWSSSVGTWICLLARRREAENLRGIERWTWVIQMSWVKLF